MNSDTDSLFIGSNSIDILNHLAYGVYCTDINRKITYWSKGLERLTGVKSSDTVGKFCNTEFFKIFDDNDDNPCHKGRCLLNEAVKTGLIHKREYMLQSKNGYKFPITLSVAPVKDFNREVKNLVALIRVSTSRMAGLKNDRELKRMAFTDGLTGIGNRRFTEMQLSSRLDDLRTYDWPFGILFIDIDRFKTINDKYGHHVGDEVLKTVANKISSNLRPYDFLGRWGGEEFIAIVNNFAKDRLFHIADRLRFVIERSDFFVDSETISLTVSIGATFGKINDTVVSLVCRADKLMYMGKLPDEIRFQSTVMSLAKARQIFACNNGFPCCN
ncbi:MAG: diguanylate cyclase [Planctomycetes bacterium]|nr:diguanylate cyclase [Planctomycetota bacterium]